VRVRVCGIVIGQTMQPEPTLVSSGCRFCKVCGITSTTQWRRGPDGYISYVVGTAAALICWRETQPVVAQEDMPNQANNDPRTHRLCNACGLHFLKIVQRERNFHYPEPRLTLAVSQLVD